MNGEGFPGMEVSRSKPSYMVMVAYQDAKKAIWEEGRLFRPRNFGSLLVAYVEGDPVVMHQRGS